LRILARTPGRPVRRRPTAGRTASNRPDTDLVPISGTIGTDRLVDETIVRFTHTIEMEWMLPGIAPTGRRVECPIVAIVTFRDGKLSNEHVHWDQASVPVQLGLLDADELIERAWASRPHYPQ